MANYISFRNISSVQQKRCSVSRCGFAIQEEVSIHIWSYSASPYPAIYAGYALYLNHESVKVGSHDQAALLIQGAPLLPKAGADAACGGGALNVGGCCIIAGAAVRGALNRLAAATGAPAIAL